MKKISIILFIGALFLPVSVSFNSGSLTIKNANENGARYDLSKLKKCKDSTTVVVDLNEKKEIVKYNYDLKCD